MIDECHYKLTTASPLKSVTRITHFFSSSTDGSSKLFPYPNYTYFSDGITRPNELSCIIQYTLEGCGETWVKNRRFAVPEHHAFINVINRVDTGYRYPEGETRRWKFITLSFNDGCVRETFRELVDRYGPVFDLASSHDNILAIVSQIVRKKDQVFPLTETSAIYNRVLSLLLENVSANSDRYNRLINEIHALVERDITGSESIRIGVSEIAGEVGLSREYLSKLYKSCTGQTLKSYIDRRRVNYICHLLYERGMTCAEAARELGIDYPANLTAYFRRCTGFTPSKYREMAELSFTYVP